MDQLKGENNTPSTPATSAAAKSLATSVRTCDKEAAIILKKLSLDNPTQGIIVSQQLMDSIPKSKYRKGWKDYYPTCEHSDDDSSTEISPRALPLPIPYDKDDSSSDDTVLYTWQDPIDNVKTEQKQIPPISGASRKPKFNINVHGIRCRRPKYWFKCKVGQCTSTFSTIKGWNFHHQYAHKDSWLECDQCVRRFKIPSAHRAHHNAHAVRKHKCKSCDKTFAFYSGVRQQMACHIKQPRHRCFAGNCKRSCKWASALNRHVHVHLDRTYKCTECNYNSREEQQYKRHLKKHSDEYKCKCPACKFKTKWPTPFKRHLSCKAYRQ